MHYNTKVCMIITNNNLQQKFSNLAKRSKYTIFISNKNKIFMLDNCLKTLLQNAYLLQFLEITLCLFAQAVKYNKAYF